MGDESVISPNHSLQFILLHKELILDRQEDLYALIIHHQVLLIISQSPILF